MFVPYGDPAATHYRKLVLDEGEYGIGLLTNSLELGCDCLGEIRYLDGVVNDNDGKAMVVPNAICLHEEDNGIAWKHTDFRTGYVEVRRMPPDGDLHRSSPSATTSTPSTGTSTRTARIEYQVKLTGVISNGAVAAGEARRTARSSRPASTGRTTSTSSTCASTWPWTARPTASSRSNPRRRCQTGRTIRSATRGGPQEVLIESEAAGARSADPLGGRFWKVVNNQMPNDWVTRPATSSCPTMRSPLLLIPAPSCAGRASSATSCG